MKDLVNIHDVKSAVNAVTVSDNTAQVGNWIDLSNCNGVLFAIITGTLADADATFTVLVEDADASNKSDAAAVADSFLIGTEALAGFTFALDGGARKIGYKGIKKFVRLTITPVNNASGAPIAAAAILLKDVAPTANPPA